MDRKKDYDEGFFRTKARVIDDISSFAALFALCLSSILMRQESDSLVSVPVGLLSGAEKGYYENRSELWEKIKLSTVQQYP